MPAVEPSISAFMHQQVHRLLPRISWLSAGAPARKLHQLHKLTSTACQGGNFNSISKIITTDRTPTLEKVKREPS
jgi:hypothetical protein